MYFLIGLGIILAIVYGNMLLDFLKERKQDKQKEQTADKFRDVEMPESMEGAVHINQTSAAHMDGAFHMDRASDMDRASAANAVPLAGAAPGLAELIGEKLKQNQYIFGLPLRLCETDGQGKLIAIDREDNIYIIETGLRREYETLYQQVMDDMAAEKKRIAGKKTDERKVYVIICTNSMTEELRTITEKRKNIRVFQYDLSFRNIM